MAVTFPMQFRQDFFRLNPSAENFISLFEFLPQILRNRELDERLT